MALEEVLQYYGPPDIFNSDQGCKFTSIEFTQKLLNQGDMDQHRRKRSLD
ncbi:hypothetical protein IFVP182_C260020 [Vibrio parahaemolyticus]